MAMFDYYRPQPLVACPVCGEVPAEWQGHDGPCGLFVWEQGVAAPIDQVVSTDARLEPSALAAMRLPRTFTIRARCCSSRFSIEAQCIAPHGVWVETSVVTAANATQHKQETRADFTARLKWLSNAGV